MYKMTISFDGGSINRQLKLRSTLNFQQMLLPPQNSKETILPPLNTTSFLCTHNVLTMKRLCIGVLTHFIVENGLNQPRTERTGKSVPVDSDTGTTKQLQNGGDVGCYGLRWRKQAPMAILLYTLPAASCSALSCASLNCTAALPTVVLMKDE